jgi:hypothetical protein
MHPQASLKAITWYCCVGVFSCVEVLAALVQMQSDAYTCICYSTCHAAVFVSLIPVIVRDFSRDCNQSREIVGRTAMARVAFNKGKKNSFH